MSGVYSILNTFNGKRYIGSTIGKIAARWAAHQRMLRDRTHSSSKFQAEWDQYGENAFVLKILEECEPGIVTQREQFWIEHFDSCVSGYNVRRIAWRDVNDPATNTRTTDSVQVMLYLDPEMAAALDAARGTMGRQEYILRTVAEEYGLTDWEPRRKGRPAKKQPA